MLIDVVVAVLYLVLEYANDLVGNAIEAEVLADGFLAGESFLLGVGADDCHPGVGQIVSLV